MQLLQEADSRLWKLLYSLEDVVEVPELLRPLFVVLDCKSSIYFGQEITFAKRQFSFSVCIPSAELGHSEALS